MEYTKNKTGEEKKILMSRKRKSLKSAGERRVLAFFARSRVGLFGATFFFTTRRNRLSVQANGSVDEAKDKLSPFASDVLEVKFASEIEGFFAERKIITVPILHVPAGISRERIYLPNALVILLLRMFRVKGTFEVEEEKQLMRPKVANARYISRRPVCLRNSEINRVDAAQCTASSPIFFALPFCHTYQRVSFSRQLDCAGNII